uniref:Complement receptor type 1-like n=1 Tax=Cynoglossus semilaevis TaxID=244447 RepID=A0A3P8WLJ9_CYNSE
MAGPDVFLSVKVTSKKKKINTFFFQCPGCWFEPVLSCSAVVCDEPEKTNAERSDFQEPPHTYRNVIHYQCRSGTLVGKEEIWCTENGRWSAPPPHCAEEGITCPAPLVANSVMIGGEVPPYQVGHKVTFTCRPGFHLTGSEHITCGSLGMWQPKLPRCILLPMSTEEPFYDVELPPAGGCSRPAAIKNSNADLTEKYMMRKTFSSGDQVQYMCNVGYAPAGGSSYRTCRNGKWTGLFMRCERKMCGTAGEILNGEFSYTGVEFGDTATAVCNNGYVLVGQKTRNCLSNGWDGRIPVCEAVVCDEPEKTNAERSDFQEPPHTYRNVIHYQCPSGTLVGKEEIWCTENGRWSAPPPHCAGLVRSLRRTCPPPNVANAYWTHSHYPWHHYGDVISVSCTQGYVLTGPSAISCGVDGQWSPVLPECKSRK